WYTTPSTSVARRTPTASERSTARVARRPALTRRRAGERQDGVDVPAHRHGAHAPRRQFDREGGVARERGVLPGGEAAGEPPVVAKRKADEAGVPAFDASVAARVVDQPGVLVIPDADGGLQPADQAQDGPRLGLRGRMGSRP